MSGRIECSSWSFFKKVKPNILQDTFSEPDGVHSESTCIDKLVASDDSQSSLQKRSDNGEKSSRDNSSPPFNNNWIVDNWFKTWPTREKPKNHESLNVNLNYKDFIKQNIISLDVIAGSDDTSLILSMLRSSQGKNHIKMPKSETAGEQALGDVPVTLDSLLESLPLVYNPSTKQLHLGRCRQRQHSLNSASTDKKHVKSSSADAATVKDEKLRLLIDDKVDFTTDLNSESEQIESLDLLINEDEYHLTTQSSLPQASTTNSLSFTDASSFSSLASSNTDLSLYSASDSAVCLGRETPLSDSIVPKRKKGLAHFLSRNLFSWKGKEEPSTTLDSLDTNIELGNHASSESLSSTGSGSLGWRIFSRSSSSKGKTDLKAGTAGLIMQDRPSHLPAKTVCEQEKHKQEYESMVSAVKRKEAREAREKQKAQAAQIKLERQMASAVQMWNKIIIPKWSVLHTQKKCRDLWWLGIPSCTRGHVWKLAIGNELNISPSRYKLLVQKSLEKLHKLTENVEEPVKESSFNPGNQEATIDLIRLDVSRTFPHLCIFQKGGPYHDPLHNILGAYVVYRPDIGYVQGMSFLAATLLLNMDEPEAFIAFANLLNTPVHMAFFSVDQRIMQAYYKTLEQLIAENLPDLGEHLQKLKVSADLYFLDWILTIFSRSLPLDISARIWDLYLRDGEEFLFRAAVGILKLFENELKSQECTVISAQLLTRLPDDINQETLFKAISSVQMTANRKPFNQVLQFNIKASPSYKLS